jgi:NAD(P)-dependent dehydrogenase (short-subunit alcohol dehydrogenase family)
VKRYGALHVLYNNAGIMMAEDRSVVDTEEWVWDRTLAVNLKGIYLCCRHGIPEMMRSGGGSVINIASFVALLGCSVPQDAYTASKGAVIALTKSLAVQFAPRGVRSNAICPGPIETPLLTEWLLKDPEARRVRLARNPTGRFGRPEDIVNAGIFLASDESAWTNGAVLVIDGGITSNYF